MRADSSPFELQDDLRLRRDHDLRVRLLQLYILFALIVLAGAVVLAVFARQRVVDDVRRQQLTLARALAQHLDLRPEASPDLPAQLALQNAWYDLDMVDAAHLILVVDQVGARLIQTGPDRPVDQPAWRVWEQNVERQAMANATGSFTGPLVARVEASGGLASVAPDGQDWLHTYAATPDGLGLVIVGQAAPVALATSALVNRGLFIAGSLFFLGGLIFWLALSRLVITPLVQLEVFSGLVRWRGQVRPEEAADLDRLAGRSDQIGSLARSLVGMAEDIERRFIQLSTLLETSRIVAASLELSRVIDNILNQVRRLFDVERSAVVVLDRRAGVFRIRASRGLSAEYVRQLAIQPAEPSSPSMRALRNQAPVQVADVKNDLAYAPLRDRAVQEGFRSVLAIPLTVQHAPPAVLILYKSTPHRYSYSELALASSFGHHASIAMENAALFKRSDEQLQEQTRRLEAIVESLNDGLILESLSGEVLYCNWQATLLAGLDGRQERATRTETFIERLVALCPDPAVARAQLSAALDGDGTRTLDLGQTLPDGSMRDLRLHIFDVTDAHGERIGRGHLWQDISQDKELERMKSALLSTVSHELRTPLATIKGYASTLLAEDVAWDSAMQREFLQTISAETDRLAGLVKSLLDMSRIEAGLLDMQRALYAVEEIVEEIAASLAPEVRSRLEIAPAPAPVLALVDSARIETVIRNLLDNAVKYAPANSPIELTVTVAGPEVVVAVRDYGPGIPAGLGQRIFDRFVRADNRLTRQVGGAGLGLAICKGFVEAHGGRIWAEDARPGARFGFTLPAHQPAAAALPAG